MISVVQQNQVPAPGCGDVSLTWILKCFSFGWVEKWVDKDDEEAGCEWANSSVGVDTSRADVLNGVRMKFWINLTVWWLEFKLMESDEIHVLPCKLF